MTKLHPGQAEQFALILLSGAPVVDAVDYFLDAKASDAQRLAAQQDWPAQEDVLAAIQRYTGGEKWHEMDDAVRMKVALNKHYNEMAYFLWTANYTDMTGNDKLKADTCRIALETKVAGMAGQESPLARFYHDMLSKYEHAGTVS
jgi:hypothetical protein|tara:strand:+ start:636 stop:1070 length:435 start_codon:yes stop_codon:yes gene_type:complete